jgi:hypothetical protein
MKPIPFDKVASLASALLRARRYLAAESPYGPAWAATCEWVAELEGDIRSLGMDPDAATRSVRPAEPVRDLVRCGRVA